MDSRLKCINIYILQTLQFFETELGDVIQSCHDQNKILYTSTKNTSKTMIQQFESTNYYFSHFTIKMVVMRT